MGLSDAAIREGDNVIEQVVKENLGMAMVYQIVTELQEWIDVKVLGGNLPVTQ